MSPQTSLIKENGIWILKSGNGQSFTIDFDNNKIDYQRKNISKKNILAKAIGLKSTPTRVLDLTAGLGIDAIHLSMLGCEVVSLERNPDLFVLLDQAWKNSVRPEVKKIKFLQADARAFLTSHGSTLQENFDVIYYDPMYPEKKKSALPRKEMKMFRELVGSDNDIDEVIELVLQMGFKRFVIKRPNNAEILNLKQKPIVFSGTTVQYQVFLSPPVSK